MYRSKWSSLVKQHVKQKGFNKVFFRRSFVGATLKGTTVNSLR